MKQFSIFRQNWLTVVLGLFLMGVLSSCVHVDCTDCGKCGSDGTGDRNCDPMPPPEGMLGVACAAPGSANCNIFHPEYVCTNDTQGNFHFCKCCPPSGCP